ncbi:hypothetical protein ACHAXR_001850, partial [Thalassiosira sp. AJA248-18]
MSSSQSNKTPQPRGLPGFLRRTFRNSNEQDTMLDSPSSAPKTPVLPDDPYMRSADNIGGSSNEGDTDDGGRSKSESDMSDDGMKNKSGKAGYDANSASEMNTTPRAGSGGIGSGIKRHLRAVAFPPLPNETEGNDSDSTTSLHSAKATSTTKTQLPNPSTDSKPENSNPPATSTPPKSYKETQFEVMLDSTIIPLRDLRKLAWNGIPPHHRPVIWKILLGYLPANASRHTTTLQRRRREYKDAIKQHYDIPDDSRTNCEQETLRQVLVDVPRTAPEVPLFHNDRVRRCLSRLLYIWAMRHPASSYVQGINDLATPLISVFLSGYFGGTDCLDGEIMADVTDQMLEEVEADTYWCLTNLLAGIQDHYTSDQPGMQRMVMHLEELVNRIDADLATHLRNTGIEFIQFAFKWMNCLLLREFRLSCVMRLWDTYLSEGDGGFEDFHVYVCASFLVHFSNELQQMGFDELFQFMQNMPTDDWGDREVEVLLSSAFVLSTLFRGSEAHLNVVR